MHLPALRMRVRGAAAARGVHDALRAGITAAPCTRGP